MKKSEAIAQLAGYLSTYVWYEKKHPEELLELARHALEGMEKIGMRPPALSDERAQHELMTYVFPNFHQWDEDFDKAREQKK